jgi:L,D-transpeptidase ErfK/SrfK
MSQARSRKLTRGLAALCGAGLLLAHPAAAEAAEFVIAHGSAGQLGSYIIQPGDTLLDVARRFDLGYTQLLAANPGVDPWLPPPGTRVLLPSLYLLPDAPHRGVVVNLAAERLFYYPPGGRRVETFPIGVASEPQATPLGETRVVAKQASPTWYPPPSLRAAEPNLPRAIPPGPNNPLGAFALQLGWPGYLIHGTNKPDGVGRMVSHGCIRLYPDDIARLYREVPVGTPVTVIDQPVVVHWIGDELFIEVHPSVDRAAALESGAAPPSGGAEDVPERVTAAAGAARDRIDWSAVERAQREQTGIPVLISLPLNVASGAPPLPAAVQNRGTALE